MNIVPALLGYIEHHPFLSIAIVFLISMGEALIVVGLFVPSTAVLVGAGALIGLGRLYFWPIFLAGAVGAFAGDAVSYWAGRRYGHHLKEMWPLKHYPDLMTRGEEFFASHGMKSIAIGRFIPAVKAIVPGIAGMMHMDRLRFSVINATSAVAWSGAHIIPGILIGRGLSLANQFSPRLVVLLLAVLILMALAAYVARLAVLVSVPIVERARFATAHWAASREGAIWQSIARVLDPTHPHAITLLLWSAVLIAALVAFVSLLEDVMDGGSLVAIDHSVSNFFQSMRTVPGDTAMVAVTMLGDGIVLTVLAVATVLWLAWHRAWYVAATVSVAFVAAAAFVPFLKTVLQRTRPAEFYAGADAFSFPSGHATLSATIFGILALLIATDLPRWWRAATFSLCAALVTTIAFSRIYLLAHWPSDVVAGLAFGMAMTASVALALNSTPRHVIAPQGLAMLIVLTFPVIVSGHLAFSFDRELHKYTARHAVEPLTMTRAAWLGEGWRRLLPTPEELADEGGSQPNFAPSIIQWAGPQKNLETALQSAGWTSRPDWKWSNVIDYLKIDASLTSLQPLPRLYDGRFPIKTFTKHVAGHDNEQLVMRFWRSPFAVSGSRSADPVLIGALSQERLWRPMGALSAIDRVAGEGQLMEHIMTGLSIEHHVSFVRKPTVHQGVSTVTYLAYPTEAAQ